ncbi:hypothetical protein [Pelagibius sp. Alg239-R121]|uniref:hypothetical protein n=1 Tax=Pelagibius sp. Alg239-R121 TaxID=2993448 RepID=UPI0024A73BFF|nr:hypothetical protein [Pelagibius sp. Alg239-R121]
MKKATTGRLPRSAAKQSIGAVKYHFVNPKSAGKKLILIILLLIAITGLAISVTFLVINISEIPNQIESNQSIFETSDRPLSSEPERASIDERVRFFSRFIAILRGASIDLSAVTPFLFCWFFFDLARNTTQAARGRITEERLYDEADVLPLHFRYERQWIEFGLLGTLWGFMLIGWGMKDVVGNVGAVDTLDILLKAFGTALLSTFTGTVLAYVFGPLVIRVWRWIYDLSDPTAGSTESSLARLEERLKSTSVELAGTENSIVELKTAVDRLSAAVEKQSPEKIIKLWNSISTGLTNVNDSVKSLPDSFDKNHTAGVLKSDLAEIKKAIKGVETGLANQPEATKNAVDGLGAAFAEVLTRVANMLSEKITQTEGEMEKKSNSHRDKVDRRFDELLSAVRKQEHRTHVTIEIKDLDSITDLHQKLVAEIKAITDSYSNKPKKRGWWPRPFGE